MFGLLIAYAIWRANTRKAQDQLTAHMHRMYIMDGGVEAFAFPSSVGENVSCGEGVVSE